MEGVDLRVSIDAPLRTPVVFKHDPVFQYPTTDLHPFD